MGLPYGAAKIDAFGREYPNVLLAIKSNLIAPSRLAGNAALVVEPIDQTQRPAQVVDLRTEPAPRLPRSVVGVRLPRTVQRQSAHDRRRMALQRPARPLRVGTGRQAGAADPVQRLRACTAATSVPARSSGSITSSPIWRATSCIACGSWRERSNRARSTSTRAACSMSTRTAGRSPSRRVTTWTASCGA